MTDFVRAIHDMLQGITYAGEAIPVYLRGNEPTTKASPSILIEIPDTVGSETLDRAVQKDLRLRIRVLDERGTEGFHALRQSEVADRVVNALRPSVDVNGQPVGIFEPERRQIPEDETRLDTVLLFDTFIST